MRQLEVEADQIVSSCRTLHQEAAENMAATEVEKRAPVTGLEHDRASQPQAKGERSCEIEPAAVSPKRAQVTGPASGRASQPEEGRGSQPQEGRASQPHVEEKGSSGEVEATELRAAALWEHVEALRLQVASLPHTFNPNRFSALIKFS